jgi:hypothetical protein
VLLAGLALTGHSSWPMKLLFIASMAFLLGTFREAWIGEGRFMRRMSFAFVPGRVRSWPLERFVEIEAKWTGGVGIEWSLLMGACNWMPWRTFDWLLPWLGGEYELRLRGAKLRVLVWQGNSDANFKANLQALEAATGLTVIRK